MHCNIKINETTILITGGRLVRGGGYKSTFQNVETGRFIEGPRFKNLRSHGHGCGKFTFKGKTYALVAFGRLNSVEILDLEKQGRSCSASVNFPAKVRDASGGGFKDTGIVQCGGNYAATEKCYYLAQDATFHEATYSLQTKRYRASSVALPNGTFVITGGIDQNNNRLKTIEIIDTVNGDVSVPQQTLPEPIRGHCSILVNESVILIIGGKRSGSYSRKTTFFDIQTLKSTPGPEMRIARSSFGCATMTSKVIVAGGYSGSRTETSEILDLKSNNPSWQPGKLNIIENLLNPASTFYF